MYPDIFQLAKNSPAVTALIGDDPVRFWAFDIAPGPNQQGYGVPYAVHQLVYGSPENTLSCPPSVDMIGIQVDSYATTQRDARAVSSALRDAIEGGYNHVVSLNGESFEADTGLYRSSFTAEFWVERGT